MAQLKNTTVDGSLSVSGAINTDGSIATGSSLTVEGGQFELYGTDTVPTPYIDFHYGGDTSDYTSRIMESESGTLNINGVQIDEGSNMYANRLIVDKSIKHGTDELVMLYMSSNNNLTLGQYSDSTTTHTGHTYVNAYNGTVYIQNRVGCIYWSTASADDYTGAFMPLTDKGPLLGGSSHRWYRIYAASATVLTSDEREKSDIMSIADYPTMYSRDSNGNIFEQLFDKLQPKTYLLDADKTNKLHIGFVAQDVSKSMEELGLSESDLGFLVHDYWTDEETGEERDRYGLAYEEFMALNTYMIQKQKAKIATLEERIAQLEELVSAN